MRELWMKQLSEDGDFCKKMDIMLSVIYWPNSKTFIRGGYVYEDFRQEMWVRLFEERSFNGDVKLSMTSIKHNAYDLLRDIRNRNRIARFQP